MPGLLTAEPLWEYVHMDKRYGPATLHHDGTITPGQPSYGSLQAAKDAAYDTARGQVVQVVLEWTHGRSQPSRQWERYRVGGSWGRWTEVMARSAQIAD